MPAGFGKGLRGPQASSGLPRMLGPNMAIATITTILAAAIANLPKQGAFLFENRECAMRRIIFSDGA
jgi:hypothetical protein